MRDGDATMPKIARAIVLRHIDLEGTVLRYSRFRCSVAIWIAPSALSDDAGVVAIPRHLGRSCLASGPAKARVHNSRRSTAERDFSGGTTVDIHGGTISPGSPRGAAPLYV
jgi:hypothetical protein